MDRQAIIDDILRRALGSNDDAPPSPEAVPSPPEAVPSPVAPTVVIHAQQVFVINGPVILCSDGRRAAEALADGRCGLAGQALRSAAENRRRLDRLGPPKF
ncbi:hypothetical protein [Caenispirillum bisanense]|uniref:Uncharacterized protein n=1 Tax=Caenispirillum bisanense TaxID=414052 RepID=A0A286G6U2_9PROT|nr:hypothetical protein [Caenispirillum bisanense]SOD90839.1 hypothetical protein SAMN05421508_101681 [Caenispirillum bisanense]